MSFLRRKRENHIFRNPRVFSFFRRNTEALVSQGNRITLLRQGGEFLTSLFSALQNAEHSIVLECNACRLP